MNTPPTIPEPVNAQPAGRPPSRPIETMLSRLLTAGVLLAVALLSSGAVLNVVRNAGVERDLSVYIAQRPELANPGSIVRGALRDDELALMQLGILVLIATPVARVCFALVGFALQRDRLYTIISLIVLAVLTLGLAGIVH